MSQSPPAAGGRKGPRILFVRLSAIGDILHTLPALTYVRSCLPEAHIGWVVEELSAPYLDGHPGLDEVFIVPRKRWRGRWTQVWRSEVLPYFRALRARGWDSAIDFQGLTKSGLVAWASGAPRRVGYGDRDGRELNKLFTTVRVKPPASARHVVERNLALVEGLGLTPPQKPVYGTLALRNDERAAAERFFAEWGVRPGEGVVALNPGAGWSSKRWPPGHFAALGAMLARETGMRMLVFWGPREEPLRDAIVEGLRERGVEAQAAPPTTLRQLAAFVERTALFVGGDTGPTHLAALLGVPTVGVFGSSDSVRNGPWGPRAITVARTELDCLPCWKTQCPLVGGAETGIPCLEGLAPEVVAKAALNVLKKT